MCKSLTHEEKLDGWRLPPQRVSDQLCERDAQAPARERTTAQQAGTMSGFVDVDQAANPGIYIDRLDRTGNEPFWQAIKLRMLDALDLLPGDRALDIGCGTGSDVRALAELVGTAGQAVGIDRSSTLVEEAHRRSEGGGLPAHFLRGDARALPFADATFSACRAERVLQHLADPGQALAEMARVTRPDGRLVVVEPDFGTETIRGADPALTRRILACRRAHFRQPLVGRALQALFNALQLRGVSATVIRLAVSELSVAERQVAGRYAERAAGIGAISAEEGAHWLAELEVSADADLYQHSVGVFLVGGQK